MIIKFDYGDRIIEFSDIRYHTCKALEEIIYEMMHDSGIKRKETVVNKYINKG